MPKGELMVSLKSVIESNNLSMKQAADLIGVDKSHVVRVCVRTYPTLQVQSISFLYTH